MGGAEMFVPQIYDAINTLPNLYIKIAKSTDHTSNFFTDVITSSASIAGSASNLTRTLLSQL
jgi:hypothetical protein